MPAEHSQRQRALPAIEQHLDTSCCAISIKLTLGLNGFLAIKNLLLHFSNYS